MSGLSSYLTTAGPSFLEQMQGALWIPLTPIVTPTLQSSCSIMLPTRHYFAALCSSHSSPSPACHSGTHTCFILVCAIATTLSVHQLPCVRGPNLRHACHTALTPLRRPAKLCMVWITARGPIQMRRIQISGSSARPSTTHCQRFSCFIQASVSSSRSLWMTSSVSTLRANLRKHLVMLQMHATCHYTGRVGALRKVSRLVTSAR